MRASFLATLVAPLMIFAFDALPPPLRIDGPAESAAYKLVQLRAVGDLDGAALIWDVTPDDLVDQLELPDGRFTFTAPPGTYKVRLRTVRVKDGVARTETARSTVTIKAQAPATPPPPARPKTAAPDCIGKLRVGDSGCTATPIWPQRPDGRWDVLTASHCTAGPGTKGELTLKDGRTFTLTVTARQEGPDITWFVTDQVAADMPFGVLATGDPPPGTPCWQAGYGQTRPTIRKDGAVIGSEPNGQLAFRILVDHGDSGGPIFRADTNEVVACVCCTRVPGFKTEVFGGSATTAARIRPGSTDIPVAVDAAEAHADCTHPVLREDTGLRLPHNLRSGR